MCVIQWTSKNKQIILTIIGKDELDCIRQLNCLIGDKVGSFEKGVIVG